MGEYCLFCHEEILPQISWVTIFSKMESMYVCESCENKLEEIRGVTCEVCDRPFKNLNPQYIVGSLCIDCARWEKDPRWKGLLRKNESIYFYNEFFKEIMTQFKFRGDYILVKAFSKKVRKKLENMEFDRIVPIPLSKERLYERGFNQSEALVKEAGFHPSLLLERIHTEKQSKKSRSERIHLKQVFKLKSSFHVAGEKIVLVDDIYTTGSTLRHAAKILKHAGAKEIFSLTLARG